MDTLRTPDEEAAARARRSRGLLTHEQALAAGLSDRQIEARVASRGWTRLARGLYVLPGAPPSWRRDVLAVCLDVRGAASYVSALALAGIHGPSLLPHATTGPGKSNRSRLGRVHRAEVDPVDRCTIDGIPSHTASRAIVELAGVASRPLVEEVVDAACCGGLATAASIAGALERAGRVRGAATVRATVAAWHDDITPGSPAEVRLARLVEGWGFPPPERQVEVHDRSGAFVARIDLGWPEHRIGLEYDSVRWHGPRRWERDESRYARLAALGWRVDGVTRADLRPGELRLRDRLSSWLATSVAS